MTQFHGVAAFGAGADAYDAFMGRYAVPLAHRFSDAAGVRRGQSVLDVGCGPGALTSELESRLGAAAVTACDPAPGFVAACARRHPDVEVVAAGAEALPFADDSFDLALAQLVLHFVADPERASAELARVVKPGGGVGACVWDFAQGMEMLRLFWDAALSLDPGAPDEARVLRFGAPGEISALFRDAGLVDIAETTLVVDSAYVDFDELWSGFLAGVGPAGVYCTSLGEGGRADLRDALFERLGSPPGPITLAAVARCVTARVASYT